LYIQIKKVASFHPVVLAYEITLPSNTHAIPYIAFETANPDMQADIVGPIDVFSQSESDRIATITTTSADGSDQKIYTLTFEVGDLSTNGGSIENDPADNFGFTIHPNPAAENSAFIIEMTDDNSDHVLFVRSLTGELIFSVKTKGENISIDLNNSLERGV
jgi:hypothetical protein